MMDLISRRDVIDAVIKYCTKYDLRELLADLEVLPPVEQAQKTGKWRIYFIPPYGEGCVCSECGCEGAPDWNYCSNCGCRMVGAEDE